MSRVQFTAYGHHNITGKHRTTLEITTEEYLTKTGTCIIGISSDNNLAMLDDEIRNLARNPDTIIMLRMSVNGIVEEIRGHGSPGLSYENKVSMVARTSDYECDRTLMIRANKAASDLSREFIENLKEDGIAIVCELSYFTQ